MWQLIKHLFICILAILATPIITSFHMHGITIIWYMTDGLAVFCIVLSLIVITHKISQYFHEPEAK